MSERIEEGIPSSTNNSPRPSPRNRPYETTYQREYVSKRSSSIAEGIPLGQRFPVSSPYDLAGPINTSLYTADYSDPDNLQQKVFVRPNTNRANRPRPHRDFPHGPRKSESMLDLSIGETDQALRNQLNSIYQVDSTGAAQGFAIPLAYSRLRPHWRHRAQHTLDSEYRFCFRDSSKQVPKPNGRFGCSSRISADAVVPQTVPVWKKTSLQSIYKKEIREKSPSNEYMRDFFDSLNGPMDE